MSPLPPFAQAFSMAALPLHAGKKRTHSQDDHSDSDVSIRVKQELEDPSPPSPPPPPSTTTAVPMPSSKKRRVTVSGGPQPLRIDVRTNPEQPASTPISPVVMGFTIQRDNPNAIEQVRSMISVKQKQKALIEQRRGSVAGLMSPVGNAPPTPVEDRNSKIPPPPSSNNNNNRISRRSPNTGTGARRLNSHPQHPPSPQPPPPSQQVQQQQTPPTHSLPPPPISFARRRAAQLGAKKKPADILISPREAHTQDQFQPSIQSAPPIPQAAGQSQFYPTRFTMALPRLPATSIGAGDNVRRITGNVPPTPTRFSMQHNSSTAPSIVPGPLRSPTASVPIASTLVPPTPISLHRPGYSGEKSAFLAPFEVFYDALNDSKQLKTWLGEQLQKSHSLIQSLTQQQDRINNTVDSLVEKKMAGMKSEMSVLRRRVEDLEDALRMSSTGNKLQNGVSCGAPIAPESYSFPPIPGSSSHDAVASSSRLRAERPGLPRRLSSPGWGQERDREGRPLPQPHQAHQHHHQHASESDNISNGSPAPFDARRLSMSATRLDPPRVQHQHSVNNSIMQSPPQGYREHNHNHNSSNPSGKSLQQQQQQQQQHIIYPPTPTSGHLQPPSSRNGGDRDRPLSRQNSSLSVVMVGGGPQREHDSSGGSASGRRVGSRRNSIVMSGPDGES
ncbi:hypothetical protein BYT27DRAFT_7218091 [Phlegmacium glaucopus]|nr:hypothetical protein BYT27DRAFT_7218091 [Phlegmacium glaucopus]